MKYQELIAGSIEVEIPRFAALTRDDSQIAPVIPSVVEGSLYQSVNNFWNSYNLKNALEKFSLD